MKAIPRRYAITPVPQQSATIPCRCQRRVLKAAGECLNAAAARIVFAAATMHIAAHPLSAFMLRLRARRPTPPLAPHPSE